MRRLDAPGRRVPRSAVEAGSAAPLTISDREIAITGTRTEELCLAALLVPGVASARTITLGSELVAPFTNTQTFKGSSHITVANAELTGPINPASAPVDGMIVRWRLAP
ncbi:MAG TPA: hypothetical protein VGH14_15585 [Solirubrobacterales bacterium]